MKAVDYLFYLWNRAFHYGNLKALAALVIGVLGFFFDPLQQTALLALFVLVFVDFLFGMAAAKKTGQQITSAKFFRTPIKLAVYFTLIACAHISEYALPGWLGILDETLTGFLVATELLSIFEKSGYLGFAVPRRVLNQLEEYTGHSDMMRDREV